MVRWRPLLVLHFDINKTLLMADPVSGVSMDAMIDSVLSECCWGTVQPPTDGGAYSFESWRLAHPTPTAVPPREGLITYNEYLEGVLKPDKAPKKAAKARFTKPGGVGEQLAGYHEQIRRALEIPPQLREEAAAKCPRLQSGFYHLLPSFFRLINKLEEEERDFHLVFRTFGTDIPEVVEEFNLFCDNRHPLFNPVRPDRTASRRIELPRQSGSIYRTTLGVDGIHMASVSDKNLVQVVHGLRPVYEELMAKLERYQSFALRDDYAFWARNGESDVSGKILAVERASPTDESQRYHHHVFFDDNIERDRPHIVDVRDTQTGEPVGLDESLNRYIFKAEPLQAVLDQDYYVKALEQIEQKVASTFK